MFLPVNGEDVVGLANVAFSVEEHGSIERLGLDGSTFFALLRLEQTDDPGARNKENQL